MCRGIFRIILWRLSIILTNSAEQRPLVAILVFVQQFYLQLASKVLDLLDALFPQIKKKYLHSVNSRTKIQNGKKKSTNNKNNRGKWFTLPKIVT